MYPRVTREAFHIPVLIFFCLLKSINSLVTITLAALGSISEEKEGGKTLNL